MLRDSLTALRLAIAERDRRIDSARVVLRRGAAEAATAEREWARARESRQAPRHETPDGPRSVALGVVIDAPTDSAYIAALEAAGDALAAASERVRRDAESALTLAHLQLDTLRRQVDRLAPAQTEAIAAEYERGHTDGVRAARGRSFRWGAAAGAIVTLAAWITLGR